MKFLIRFSFQIWTDFSIKEYQYVEDQILE